MASVWPEIQSVQKENRHELVLSGSAITERIRKSGLDNTLFTLKTLNFLNISETCLDTLGNELGNLSNLQTLVLHSNQLEEIPSTISKLTKLKNLDVSRNKLKALPEEISDLLQLTAINASSNCLTSIPCLSKNIKLSIIDLANNQLNQFPPICHKELVHLAELKLNKNNIEEIPAEINQLTALKIFDIAENKLKIVPFEVYECSKLKELNLKDNPLSDKRLGKLVDQCRTKQILDYIRLNSPRSGEGGGDNSSKGGKKANKKGQRKNESEQRKSESEDNINQSAHKINVLHVKDETLNVQINNAVKSVRPHILCCIVNNLQFDETSFKKFIQMQTKLHDSVCDKRNAATIATHDLDKLPSGNLLYTAKEPSKIEIKPLGRNKIFTGSELYSQLKTEAENLRKEKKRNVYSGIHKFLYLLEGKSVYPCLLDSKEQVISFPPITNSDITKMSVDTKSMLIEVTSATSQTVCKKVFDTLIYDLLFLGVTDINSDQTTDQKLHSLTVQQVKIVDLEGNMKAVYPSRSDLIYEDKSIAVIRE